MLSRNLLYHLIYYSLAYSIADIRARFVSPTVNVLETDTEEICVVIDAGTVGPGGLIIDVENTGGSATGEERCSIARIFV